MRHRAPYQCSSEIDLASFTISAANQELVFLYNSTALHLSASINCASKFNRLLFAWLAVAGAYKPDK
jgi:hypothetical protein